MGLDLNAGSVGWLDELDSPAAVGLACDVADSAAVAGAIEQVRNHSGRIDVLVNNAGIFVEGLVEDLTDEAWDRCLAVNVGGTFKMCRAVIPIMKSQRSGRIINAASFAAIVPSIGSAAYATAKTAVAHLSRALAGELGPWNITVNAYAPGMVPTAMNGFDLMNQAAQTGLLDTLTLRRWGSAQEVADWSASWPAAQRPTSPAPWSRSAAASWRRSCLRSPTSGQRSDDRPEARALGDGGGKRDGPGGRRGRRDPRLASRR